MQAERKHLSTSDLLEVAAKEFDHIKHPLTRSKYRVRDCLLGGLAIFGMKYPSLLQLDKDLNDPLLENNLKKLYQIKALPSDTHFREFVDEINDHGRLNYVYDALIRQLQRGKCLFDYSYLSGYYLVSIDGTGYFSSDNIHCKNCCEKTHKNGNVSYYHQVLSAVLVHPDIKQVFPLAIEPIIKQDGKIKNDCERNAAIRLLKRLRTSHPNFKFIIVLDALYANGPLIKLLKELNLEFIITAKNLNYMYDHYQYGGNRKEYSSISNMVEKKYEFANDLPLNETHQDIRVNFLKYKEVGERNSYSSSWITSLPVNESTLRDIVKGGRARWHIENETFNTLKNHGYHFEHNFGHGYNNLSIILCHLMFIAFLIDQIQERFGYHFKQLQEIMYAKKYLWDKLRGAVMHIFVNSWEELYTYLINRYSAIFGKISNNTT